MKIFNELLLKFEKPDWSANPEFCVIDTILESRPGIILMLNSDIIGNKSSFAITKNSGIVVRAMAFEDNIYDRHALEPQLTQVRDLLGRLPETALVDRGCKGRKHILGVAIKIPGPGKGKTPYQTHKDRQRFRRRASIEPIIEHLKQDHRMLRNYLKGVEGDMINTLLAGAAFNMMKILRKIRGSIIRILNRIINYWFGKSLILVYH